MTIIKCGIIVSVVIFLVSIICTGVFECSEKRNICKSFKESILHVLKIGFFKVISSVCIALLTAGISAFLLSLFIKPEPQNVMPAFYYDGTYSEYNVLDISRDTINMILEESEKHITNDPEIAYFDMAYAYFFSQNYDLAVEALGKCYEMAQRWEYTYDIGVSYGYLMDYQVSIKYLNEALKLNPPAYDRAVILETVEMLDNYFNIWLSSLFQ